MTKYILILLSVLLIGLSACEEKYDYTYNGPIEAQFVSTSANFFVLDTTNQVLNLGIKLIGEQQKTDVQMSIVVIDSALINGNMAYTTVEGIGRADITSLTTTIPAGESYGYFQITSEYDSLTSGVVDTLLVQLSGGDVDVAGFSNICMIKIQQYYPYIPSEYVGYWAGFATGAVLDYAWVPTMPGLTIEQGDGNRLIIATGFWQESIDEWGEVWTDGPFPIEIYMNDADPTNFAIEIPERQYLGTTYGSDGAGPYPYYVDAPAIPGSFNSTAKTMFLKANMYYSYQGTEALVDYAYYDIKLGGYTKDVQLAEPSLKITEGIFNK